MAAWDAYLDTFRSLDFSIQFAIRSIIPYQCLSTSAHPWLCLSFFSYSFGCTQRKSWEEPNSRCFKCGYEFKSSMISKNLLRYCIGSYRTPASIEISQCAPGFFNPNQKVHGLYHFYKAVIYKRIQDQLKKPSDIGLPKQ